MADTKFVAKCDPRLRQADGADVGGEVHPAVEPDDGDVVPVGLRGELEVGVDLDGRSSVGAAGQRLGPGLEDVLAQGDPDLVDPGLGHTVAGRHHVPLVD